MANREPNKSGKNCKIAKRVRSSGPRESGICKKNGVHTTAARIKNGARMSTAAAYRKALEQYELTRDELINLAKSLRLEVSQLVTT